MFKLPDEPVAGNVLIPGFRAATSVRGAFGWFTAGWIGRLAPGLAVYLNRNGTEPIDFTVAPALFPDERAAVERGVQMTPQEAAERVADVFVRWARRCVGARPARTRLSRMDDRHWDASAPNCSPHTRVELPPKNLALRRRRESGARPRVGQRDRSGRGRWRRAHRRRCVVGPRKPSQGDERYRHARRLVARQESRDQGGRRIARSVGKRHHPDGTRATAAAGRLRHGGPRKRRVARAHRKIRGTAFRAPVVHPRRPGVDDGDLRASGRGGEELGGRASSRDRRDRDGDGCGEDPHRTRLRDSEPGSPRRPTLPRRRVRTHPSRSLCSGARR